MDHTSIYTLVTLGGMILSRTSMTDDRATRCNNALVAVGRTFRWVAA